jgi:Bacterial regulatory proteins, lacI family
LPRRREPPDQPRQTVGLKFLAEYLDLSAATISVVLNNSPTAREIPQETKDRVVAAARKFNYRPNVLARSLRQRRSFTIGVLVHEISEGYGALLLNGIDACQANYSIRESFLLGIQRLENSSVGSNVHGRVGHAARVLRSSSCSLNSHSRAAACASTA